MKEHISIGLIDDQVLFRKALSGILAYHKKIQITLEGSHGATLLEYLELGKELPDVLLLDLHLPDIDGIKLTEKLREKSAESPKIIILSAHSSERYATYLIDLGANSFLNKDCEPEELLKAIEEVHNKGYYFNETIQEIIRKQKKNQQKKYLNFNEQNLLTEREKEVVLLICKDKSSREIAEELYISIKTVESHRSNAMDKVGAKSISGLVLYAVKMGWILL
ncbi:MAG: response regulator transcription factor [Raineya sp.]